MSVSVKYKGSEIAALSESGTKTLLTSGKYCEADIVLENTKDGIDHDCLAFVCDNEFTLKVYSPKWNGTMEISTDDTKTWTTWDGTEATAQVSNSTDYNDKYTLYVRGNGNTVVNTSTSSAGRFVLTSGLKIACYGNIETLLDYQTIKNGEHPTMGDNCYWFMFYGCTSLTKAPELPATTLVGNCYWFMFYGCTSLTTAPELPATTLGNGCYHSMFYGCTSLTKAPELPATTLVGNCYSYMFSNCTSLTKAPELPATTLASNCYAYMFSNCTSLTIVPKLPATTLQYSCYTGMFTGCTKLKLTSTPTYTYTIPYRIPNSGTGTTADSALRDMFANTGGAFTGTPTINNTYYLSTTNNTVPGCVPNYVTQATPSIATSSSGLIAVSAKQNAGLVAAGTKYATKQLTTQAAKTVTPGTSDQTVVASGRYTTGDVTVQGDSNLVAENIKKGTSIFGVTGTLESGGSSGTRETWVWNENLGISPYPLDDNTYVHEIPFISNDVECSELTISVSSSKLDYVEYEPSDGADPISIYTDGMSPWPDGVEYRKITFLESPTGDLLTYLQANAVKQPSDVAVQTDKSITITSNGTTNITPDVPYDAMDKVAVTVNVSSQEDVSVQITLGGSSNAASGTVYLGESKTLSEKNKILAYSYSVQLLTQTADCYFHTSAGSYLIFSAQQNGYLSKLPVVSGGATLVQGEKGSVVDLIYQITGDAVFSNIGGYHCIVAGTLITLSDGSKKPIEDITYDDGLLVWDFYNGCFSSAKPCWIKVKQTATEYNKVAFSNGSVVGFVGQGGVNGYHRIFNADVGAFTHTGTSDTPNGTHTFAENGVSPTVVSQEIVHEQVDFYNVITDKHYNLFANGILTSCKCSNLYQINDMRYVGEQLIKNEEIVEYFDNIESVRKR